MDSDCREIRTSPEAVTRLLKAGKLGEHMDASVKAAGIADTMVPFEICPVARAHDARARRARCAEGRCAEVRDRMGAGLRGRRMKPGPKPPEQGSIFDVQPYGGATYRRSTKPETSREAAIAQLPKAGTKRAQVWEFLKREGTHGATDEEGERKLGWIHQTYSARRCELAIQKLVKDSGERRLTSYGKRAAVWVACDLPA